MFFVYILESMVNGRLYYGQTNDLEDRIRRHNAGENRSTPSGRPWKMVGYRVFATRSEATLFETRLKRSKNKAYAKWLIAQPG
jgi:putative endonuclease